MTRSAYTEGWDGVDPSHSDAAWLNAYEHGKRNRRLHDAGPRFHEAYNGKLDTAIPRTITHPKDKP